MAPARRRAAKQPVSYQESDSNEDSEEDDSFVSSSDESSPPPVRARRAARNSPPTATSSTTTARTRRQPRKTYTEDVSDLEDDSDFSRQELADVDDDAGGKAPAPKTRAAAPLRARGRQQKSGRTTASPRKAPRRRMFPESSPPAVTPRVRQGLSYSSARRQEQVN